MSTDSESASEHNPYEGTHTDSDEDYLPGNEEPNRRFHPLITSSSGEDSVDSLDEIVNDHQPADNEHQTASNTPQKGRKRLVRKALWKRTIQKSKRVQGEPYVNVAGTHKPGKQIGNNCNCKLRCFDDIGQEGCTEIFHNFFRMSTKNLQDAYLYGLLTKIEVQRQRPRSGDGQRKTSTFVYKVRIF